MMKPVEKLENKELFDRLSIAIYYGAALRNASATRPSVRRAMETLLAELRQDEFLRDKMEGSL